MATSEVRAFLIADVRGYTMFTQERGDEAAARLAAEFADIVEEIVSVRHGRVVELRGDEALAVFSSPRQALRSAVELQQRFAAEAAQDQSLPLQVGIGLDAGEALPVKGGYRGAALNLAARLCQLAGPGEVLASEGVIHLARKVDGLVYVERGLVHLKGFTDQVRVVQVTSTLEQLENGPHDSLRPTEAALPIGGFLGALPSGLMVARDDEFRSILVAVDAVAGGTGRLVLLAGEPGVGKTRLAQEVTLDVRNRGFLVAAGRCYEPRQAVPYYPFLEALATAHAAAPATIRAELPRRWPYLASLLPEQLGTPPASGEGQEDQQRVFRALTGFLRAMAETAPLALLLDDLHWADGASLDLLQHLARHTRADRVLLLGTYRDVDVGRQHPLRQVMRDLNREHLVERIAIRRLGEKGTAAQLAALLGEPEVSKELSGLVHRNTEGNPFFTDEVLRALIERGDIYRQNGQWARREIEELEVPESVRDAIGERLSHLREETQELLHEAGVLGQTFRFADLQAMGNHPEEEIEASLEEATDAGLIRVMGKDGYAFNHGLTQQALYTELSPRRRRRLHLAAGDALEQLPAAGREQRVAELAWHFLQGDDAERGLPYTMLAGDQAAAVYANGEAERYFRRALGLAGELQDEVRTAETHEKLGGALHASGRYDEALAMLEKAAEFYRAGGDLEIEGRIVAQMGHVHFMRDTAEEGILRLQAALQARSESLPSSALAALYASLARLLMDVGRQSEQLDTAEKAADLARVVGDERTLLGAEATRGSALNNLGRPEEALQTLEAIISLAEAAGDLYNLVRALDNASDACFSLGDLEKCRRYRERAVEVVERRDDPQYIAASLVALSQVAFFTGDWNRAEAYLEKADAIHRSMSTSRTSHQILFTRVWLYLAKGEMEAATRDLEEWIAAAEPGDTWGLWIAYSLLAERDLLLGQPDAALARLEPLLDPQAEYLDLRTLTWAYLERGDLAQAEHTIARAITKATASHDRPSIAETMRVQGMVQSRQGRWSDATQTFEDALSLARSMTMPYLEGRILYEYGRMHAARGEGEQARERLEEGLLILRRLGARPYIERTERGLRELG
jgi:class 3 adenylate cyclase/tetratricopeptide (TPR) repeat protein